jgi:hypothetical protein
LRYFERIADPDSNSLMTAIHQMIGIVNFFQPFEKKYEGNKNDIMGRAALTFFDNTEWINARY